MLTHPRHPGQQLPFSQSNPLMAGLTRTIAPGQVPYNQKGKVTSKMVTHSAPDLARGINFYADYSGCGHWRMIWPENLLNCYGKANVQGGTVMIGDKNFYKGIKTIRIQRQATDSQLTYIKWLKQVQPECGFKIVYEIDDLIFNEDIPHYNKFRFAFEDPSIRKTSMNIMQICDEITVTNKFMKEYYIEKTGNKNITVIPNFIPKFWMDRYYNLEEIRNNYQRFKGKPRVVYCGSGAHFDVENKIGQKDDFFHVNDIIRQTVDEFQWVFVGGFPLTLRDLIHKKKVEYHEWSNLVDYPQYISKLKATVFYAPLEDSNFNKAKSDLKFIEACAFGIPSVCQDLCTYETAFHKFKTGDDLVNKIRLITGDNKKYLKEVKRARAYIEKRWMETNIDYYTELYSLPYGHKDRKLLNLENGIT
jgi:hypothetical protein